jgi:hypothetical protein
VLEYEFLRYGVRITALGGNASQTLADEVRRSLAADGRPSVMLVATDHDWHGRDIARDWIERAGPFDHVERVALTTDQVDEFGLLENPDRPGQIEIDALTSEQLVGLYEEALTPFWDASKYEAVLEQERLDRAELEAA